MKEPRMSVSGASNRFLSIHGVIQQQNNHYPTKSLKQDEMNKLRKIKGKIDDLKDKAQSNLENSDLGHRSKVTKYKLNIDTDSEDSMDYQVVGSSSTPMNGKGNNNISSSASNKENTKGLKGSRQNNNNKEDNTIGDQEEEVENLASPIIAQAGDKQNNHNNNPTNSTTVNNNNTKLQKGYLDAQITLGAEQTKAKFNAQLLFGSGQERTSSSSQVAASLGAFQKEVISFGIKKKQQQTIAAGTSEKVNFTSQAQAAIATTSSGSVSIPLQQLPLSQTTTMGYNPQPTLLNQGTSLSNHEIKNVNISNLNLNNLTNRQLQQQYYSLQSQGNSSQMPSQVQFLPTQQHWQSQQQSNSSYMDDNDECVFLKGLSQNQTLESNCELQEYIDNEKMVVSIKTTDFFTFIRLEDEVDELKRKHKDFQQHKEQITQTVQKQQMNKFNQHLQVMQEQQFNEIDQSPQRRAVNLRAAAAATGGGVLGRTDGNALSMTALMKASAGDLAFTGAVEGAQVPEQEQQLAKPSRPEGHNDFFAVFQAKKFGNILKNKILSNTRQRNYLASISAAKANVLKPASDSIDSNSSLHSSLVNENNNPKNPINLKTMRTNTITGMANVVNKDNQ